MAAMPTDQSYIIDIKQQIPNLNELNAPKGSSHNPIYPLALPSKRQTNQFEGNLAARR